PAEDGLLQERRDQRNISRRTDQGHAGVPVHSDLRESEVVEDLWRTLANCRALSSGESCSLEARWSPWLCTSRCSRARAKRTRQRSMPWKTKSGRTTNWKLTGRS